MGCSQVAGGVLLVAKVGAILSSVEVQVVEETTGTFLDEDTGVLAVSAGGKAEDAVGDGGGLG